jgi:RNA polymerase primary sigma factor
MKSIRHDRVLRAYLNDIKPFKQLPRAEEIELIKQYQATRDKKILHQICHANLRFVVSVAAEFRNERMGIDIKDLINDGNLGLIKAVERFNIKKNVKFLSYAVWWIRQAIFTSLYENGRLVRCPVNKISLIKTISKMYETMSMQEISKKLKIPEKELNEVMFYEAVSMDKELSNNKDDSFTLHDKLFQEEDLDGPLEKAQLLKILLKILTEREKFIVRRSYIERMPLHIIGKDLKLTKERTRQIKQKALLKMKNFYLKSPRLNTEYSVDIFTRKRRKNGKGNNSVPNNGKCCS